MAIQKHTLILASAAVVILFSGISIWKHFRPFVPKLGLDVMQVCGEVAGEETAKLLDGTGRVVVLRQTTGTSNNRMKSIQALRLKGFKHALKSHKQMEIIEIKDMVAEENSTDAGTEFPANAHLEMIKAYPDADAIVYLAGNPFGSSPDLAGWPKQRPACVLMEIIPSGVHELIAKGVVDVAFVLCQSSTPAEGPAKTPHDWFDRMYEVVTRNNYTALQD